MNLAILNAMFVIGTAQAGDWVLGLQAHPEFTPEVMEKAFTWLKRQGAAEQVAAAEARTVGHAADNAVMAQWIGNFLMAS